MNYGLVCPVSCSRRLIIPTTIYTNPNFVCSNPKAQRSPKRQCCSPKRASPKPKVY